MKSRASYGGLAWLAGLALLAFAPAANAATGARVLVQAWDPRTPDLENVITAADRPTVVSDALNDFWRTHLRPRVCPQIKGALGTPGIAGGQTLYDIDCETDPQVVLDVRTAGQNTLVATFAVGGYVAATSTTPTALGSYADPRFSVALTGKVELTLAVQPSREETLRVTQARFTLNDASLDSHSFSGDILEFVVDDLVPFFGGSNFKTRAEDAVNAVSIDLTRDANAALAPVNAVLVGPSDLVRVGVVANGGYVSAAFAPREFAPVTTGGMSGVLRWDGTQFAPRNGCQSFDIAATVQTGPVPMYTANAEAPRRRVGAFEATPWGATACQFTLTGLAVGWPNVLTARVVDRAAARRGGGGLYQVRFSLSGDGWDGRNVIPQPTAANRNYVVARSLDASASAAGDFSSARAQAEARSNPRVNPADDYAARAGRRRSDVVTGGVGDGTRPGDTVSLNPQPLPPGPDGAVRDGSRLGDTVSLNPQPLPPGPDGAVRDGSRPGDTVSLNPQPLPPGPGDPDVRARRQNPGAQSGIIIVSGQPDPLARKTPGRVVGTADGPPVAGRVQSRTAELDFAALAARGPRIASQDPLAAALRELQPPGMVRTGFDIGMAVAEGQTLPGPGKQAIYDQLGDDPRCPDPSCRLRQQGYNTAVGFSLQRNANGKLPATGAAIARADAAVAALRNAQADPFYRLGFDIASAIFGDPTLELDDPTLKSLGHTAEGPGSAAIRSGLSPAGQRGFDASVAFHLRLADARRGAEPR